MARDSWQTVVRWSNSVSSWDKTDGCCFTQSIRWLAKCTCVSHCAAHSPWTCTCMECIPGTTDPLPRPKKGSDHHARCGIHVIQAVSCSAPPSAGAGTTSTACGCGPGTVTARRAKVRYPV
ncbi:hypothetical protein F751_4089 [Auxenochlorella protothecoides]|uniref:Uncharacterized protein n=1 Tax=Auxenochlorella protothecoides TaxID=3075 RepID=A0A087ST71_AUXPR|nr:hypothetical protein F751_4089 [Auxenochlorella protothecoides]KFM28925.1 hypothetical protein F751_4089 [Auxenochlorella protothecoides]